MHQRKFFLNEADMPRQWYNIVADLPNPPAAILHPGTKQPIEPQDLAAIFPMGLIEQEASTQAYIDIPQEVLQLLTLWRPSPLVRALGLEKALGTSSHIYYKYEGVSPAGSHKPNTAIPQAYYNKQEGVKRLITETGAGQWGSSLALAGSFFDLQIKVFMVKVSYEQKPQRRAMMETWGAQVLASPSNTTQAGKKILAQDPNSFGSLGIAISEAVEEAAADPHARYALGSVLNHVALHQTIIGEEAIKQMKMAGEYPDVVIGAVGGGSNFAGLAFPFLRDKFSGKQVRAVAVEPSACPSLTKGKYAYDFGDTAQLTPLIKMYTLGHNFMPPGIHAGGLRYHGQNALVSQLYHEGLIEAVALKQQDIFKSSVLFAQHEGIIAAPESSHAIHQAIVEAKQADEEGKSKTILFNLSGHGHFDMLSYTKHLSAQLEDSSLDENYLQKSLLDVPNI